MQDITIWSCLIAGCVVIVGCLTIIFREFVEYVQRKKQYEARYEANKRELSIIEKKLPDIQLCNEGQDVDELIGYIMYDEGIEFSMEWGE